MTFRFKISKTLFHSGRLLISSHYKYLKATPAVLLPTPNYSKPFNFQSVLWDLKDSCEIDFVVPYVHTRSFADLADILGSVAVTVEQPLLAPVSVSPNLFFTVEIFSNDMSFAFPISPYFYPAPVAQDSSLVQPQMNEYVHGEAVQSAKQLATRMGSQFAITGGGFDAVPLTYYLTPTYAGSIVTPTGYTWQLNSYLMYFQSAYGYARGSSRFEILPVQQKTHLLVSYGALLPGSTPQVNGNAWFQDKDVPGRFIMPYHSTKTRVRLATTYLTNVLGVASVRMTPSSTTNPTIINMSAADDYQFGLFLSAPPLMYLYGASGIDAQNTTLYNALTQAWIS